MGVIKKKTGARGTEGGTKYVCDVCSSDITSTVRLCLALSVLIARVLTLPAGPHSLRRGSMPRV